MAKYFPLSQIKPNQYTNGGEFIISNTSENYVGHYYEVSNGSFYTGKNPQDGTSLLLLKTKFLDLQQHEVPLSNKVFLSTLTNPNLDIDTNFKVVEQYSEILSNPYNPRKLPLVIKTPPSKKDYNNAKMVRYFFKKNNELIYGETNKDNFEDLQNFNPNIAFDLYSAVSVDWLITGNEQEIFSKNKNIILGIEKEKNWNGFSLYFKENWSEYYQIPISENLFTSGGEYMTRNGKEYIGEYHIHPDKGPMVGAIHVPYPHEYLYPIIDEDMDEEPPSYVPPNTLNVGGSGY